MKVACGFKEFASNKVNSSMREICELACLLLYIDFKHHYYRHVSNIFRVRRDQRVNASAEHELIS